MFECAYFPLLKCNPKRLVPQRRTFADHKIMQFFRINRKQRTIFVLQRTYISAVKHHVKCQCFHALLIIPFVTRSSSSALYWSCTWQYLSVFRLPSGNFLHAPNGGACRFLTICFFDTIAHKKYSILSLYLKLYLKELLSFTLCLPYVLFRSILHPF